MRSLFTLVMLAGTLLPLGGMTAAQETHGRGPQWSEPSLVSSSAGPSGGSVGRGLAVDSQNNLHALWTENSNGFDVYYARSKDGGLTWSAGIDLANSPLPAFGANIAVGPDDILHVVWVDRRDGSARLYYTCSHDSGQTWEVPRAISGDNPRDAAVASISIDLQNRVHVAWHFGDADANTSGEPAEVFYTRSLDGGATFELPKKLNTDAHAAAFPRFSVQGTSGDVIFIPWRRQEQGFNWDIYGAVSVDGGASFTEVKLFASPEADFDPDGFVDVNGVWHLSFFSQRGGGRVPMIDYARSTDGGITWSEPTTLSQVRGRFPFWVYDYRRDVIWLFWKDERDFVRDGNGVCSGRDFCADVVAHYSTDGGMTWSELEFATDLGNTEVRFPSPAVGADGRVYVAWSAELEGVEKLYLSSRAAAPS